MDAPTKNFLKGIATAFLIAIDAFSVFIFSFLGAFGAYISFFGLDIPPSSVIDDDIIAPIFGIIIGLIIVMPIAQLVWKENQSRWQITFQSLLFLLIYLISGILAICCLIVLSAMLGLFLEKNLETLKTVCQIASLLLALGYYFWFKKVIKPQALRVKV